MASPEKSRPSGSKIGTDIAYFKEQYLHSLNLQSNDDRPSFQRSDSRVGFTGRDTSSSSSSGVFTRCDSSSRRGSYASSLSRAGRERTESGSFARDSCISPDDVFSPEQEESEYVPPFRHSFSESGSPRPLSGGRHHVAAQWQLRCESRHGHAQMTPGQLARERIKEDYIKSLGLTERAVQPRTLPNLRERVSELENILASETQSASDESNQKSSKHRRTSQPQSRTQQNLMDELVTRRSLELPPSRRQLQLQIPRPESLQSEVCAPISAPHIVSSSHSQPPPSDRNANPPSPPTELFIRTNLGEAQQSSSVDCVDLTHFETRPMSFETFDDESFTSLSPVASFHSPPPSECAQNVLQPSHTQSKSRSLSSSKGKKPPPVSPKPTFRSRWLFSTGSLPGPTQSLSAQQDTVTSIISKDNISCVKDNSVSDEDTNLLKKTENSSFSYGVKSLAARFSHPLPATRQIPSKQRRALSSSSPSCSSQNIPAPSTPRESTSERAASQPSAVCVSGAKDTDQSTVDGSTRIAAVHGFDTRSDIFSSNSQKDTEKSQYDSIVDSDLRVDSCPGHHIGFTSRPHEDNRSSRTCPRSQVSSERKPRQAEFSPDQRTISKTFTEQERAFILESINNSGNVRLFRENSRGENFPDKILSSTSLPPPRLESKESPGPKKLPQSVIKMFDGRRKNEEETESNKLVVSASAKRKEMRQSGQKTNVQLEAERFQKIADAQMREEKIVRHIQHEKRRKSDISSERAEEKVSVLVAEDTKNQCDSSTIETEAKNKAEIDHPNIRISLELNLEDTENKQAVPMIESQSKADPVNDETERYDSKDCSEIPASVATSPYADHMLQCARERLKNPEITARVTDSVPSYSDRETVTGSTSGTEGVNSPIPDQSQMEINTSVEEYSQSADAKANNPDAETVTTDDTFCCISLQTPGSGLAEILPYSPHFESKDMSNTTVPSFTSAATFIENLNTENSEGRVLERTPDIDRSDVEDTSHTGIHILLPDDKTDVCFDNLQKVDYVSSTSVGFEIQNSLENKESRESETDSNYECFEEPRVQSAADVDREDNNTWPRKEANVFETGGNIDSRQAGEKDNELPRADKISGTTNLKQTEDKSVYGDPCSNVDLQCITGESVSVISEKPAFKNDCVEPSIFDESKSLETTQQKNSRREYVSSSKASESVDLSDDVRLHTDDYDLIMKRETDECSQDFADRSSFTSETCINDSLIPEESLAASFMCDRKESFYISPVAETYDSALVGDTSLGSFIDFVDNIPMFTEDSETVDKLDVQKDTAWSTCAEHILTEEHDSAVSSEANSQISAVSKPNDFRKTGLELSSDIYCKDSSDDHLRLLSNDNLEPNRISEGYIVSQGKENRQDLDTIQMFTDHSEIVGSNSEHLLASLTLPKTDLLPAHEDTKADHDPVVLNLSDSEERIAQSSAEDVTDGITTTNHEQAFHWPEFIAKCSQTREDESDSERDATLDKSDPIAVSVDRDCDTDIATNEISLVAPHDLVDKHMWRLDRESRREAQSIPDTDRDVGGMRDEGGLDVVTPADGEEKTPEISAYHSLIYQENMEDKNKWGTIEPHIEREIERLSSSTDKSITKQKSSNMDKSCEAPQFSTLEGTSSGAEPFYDEDHSTRTQADHEVPFGPIDTLSTGDAKYKIRTGALVLPWPPEVSRSMQLQQHPGYMYSPTTDPEDGLQERGAPFLLNTEDQRNFSEIVNSPFVGEGSNFEAPIKDSNPERSAGSDDGRAFLPDPDSILLESPMEETSQSKGLFQVTESYSDASGSFNSFLSGISRRSSDSSFHSATDFPEILVTEEAEMDRYDQLHEGSFDMSESDSLYESAVYTPSLSPSNVDESTSSDQWPVPWSSEEVRCQDLERLSKGEKQSEERLEELEQPQHYFDDDSDVLAQATEGRKDMSPFSYHRRQRSKSSDILTLDDSGLAVEVDSLDGFSFSDDEAFEECAAEFAKPNEMVRSASWDELKSSQFLSEGSSSHADFTRTSLRGDPDGNTLWGSPRLARFVTLDSLQVEDLQDDGTGLFDTLIPAETIEEVEEEEEEEEEEEHGVMEEEEGVHVCVRRKSGVQAGEFSRLSIIEEEVEESADMWSSAVSSLGISGTDDSVSQATGATSENPFDFHTRSGETPDSTSVAATCSTISLSSIWQAGVRPAIKTGMCWMFDSTCSLNSPQSSDQTAIRVSSHEASDDSDHDGKDHGAFVKRQRFASSSSSSSSSSSPHGSMERDSLEGTYEDLAALSERLMLEHQEVTSSPDGLAKQEVTSSPVGIEVQEVTSFPDGPKQTEVASSPDVIEEQLVTSSHGISEEQQTTSSPGFEGQQLTSSPSDLDEQEVTTSSGEPA
ncbi:hypothetical protein PoB_003515700 [Plakobranchus ocellatus]|uniref:Uncharacterized protein n=1 Tax=Plakobranchus ocellatus TaxID=259542 RepID=A0AAV4AP10_9GAST|nr:hypothetical protein PoB_003515700 [Plakobranchus ocellatus]